MNDGGNLIEIVAIGDELLLGETVDTNSAWIARRLAPEGFRVRRVNAIGDDVDAITATIREALQRTRTVICTGGLGPTSDDLTRDVVAQLYNRELLLDQNWLEELLRRYQKRNLPMPEINRVQALLPRGAQLLHNARGTAPGIALDDDRLGMTVLLPGVPSEMKQLLEDHVLPLLRARRSAGGPIESRTIRTTSISEAALYERIADVVPQLAPLSVAFLPNLPGVDVRLTHYGTAGDGSVAAAFARASDLLRQRLGAHVYAEGSEDLAAIVARMLRERTLKIALAESCTGGLVAKRLTDAAGASESVQGGFITYANDAKQKFLGVRPETLAQHGAVSEQCAREMALGARSAMNAAVGLSITGIAGPGGGSEEKPVGLVWFAVALDDPTAQELGVDPVTARQFVFPGDRIEVRERAAQFALDLVRRTLQPNR